MESLDVIKYIGPDFASGAVAAVVYPLALEHTEESLAGGVVAAVADRAHLTDQHVSLQETLTITAPKLAASIGMQNH